jgi:DNA-binding winged helix-turn-helix (wHTH) protein
LGKIVDKEVLIAAGWPEADPGGVSEAALSAAIYRLRQKIEPEGYTLIETVTGHGWRLHEEPKPA